MTDQNINNEIADLCYFLDALCQTSLKQKPPSLRNMLTTSEERCVASPYGNIYWDVTSLELTTKLETRNGYIFIPKNHPIASLHERASRNECIKLIVEQARYNQLYDYLIGGARKITYVDKEIIGFDTAHFEDKYLNWTFEKAEQQTRIWAQIVAQWPQN